VATIIDALVVTLGLDSSNYQKGQKDVGDGLNKLKESAGSTAKEMEARGKQAASYVSAIKTELIGLFAVVTAGKGLSSFISDSVTGTAALGRFAANLGMSARELDGWGTAAEAFGGTAEGVRASMQHIAGGIQQFALTGESDLIPIFRSMGIAVSDSSGKVRDYREIMLDVADKLKGMSAQEALSFGKMLGLDDGTINLLRQGRGAVTDLVGTMTNASGITDKSVEAAQKAQKSWAIFNQQMRGIGQTIFTELAPALEVAVAWLTDLSQWVASHHDQVVTFFAAAAAGATLFALATIEIWGPIVLIAGAVAALAAGVTYLWGEWQTWTNGGKSSLGELFQVATDVFNGIKSVVTENIDTVKRLFSEWLEVIKSVFALVVALATGSTADIRKAWKDLTGDLGTFFEDWIKVVQNLAPKIGDALIKSFKGAWSYLKDRFGKIGSLFDDDDSEDEGGNEDKGEGAPGPSGSSDHQPASPAPDGGDKTLPRGIRNNNPGNLNFAGQAGATKEGGPNGRFAKFATMEEGIKAMVRQLKLYKSRGVDTIREIVKKYAPAEDGNNVSAYIAALTKSMGIGADDSIDMDNQKQMVALVKGITSHENGKGYVSDDQITGGVQLGAGVRAANTNNNTTKTSSSEISIAKIEVNTQAKDAEGIARDIGPAIQQNGLVNQAATGDA